MAVVEVEPDVPCRLLQRLPSSTGRARRRAASARARYISPVFT